MNETTENLCKLWQNVWTYKNYRIMSLTINTYSMKQPDLYYFETVKMTSRMNVIWVFIWALTLTKILAVDMLTALKSSLEHSRKHVLGSLRDDTKTRLHAFRLRLSLQLTWYYERLSVKMRYSSRQELDWYQPGKFAKLASNHVNNLIIIIIIIILYLLKVNW